MDCQQIPLRFPKHSSVWFPTEPNPVSFLRQLRLLTRYNGFQHTSPTLFDGPLVHGHAVFLGLSDHALQDSYSASEDLIDKTLVVAEFDVVYPKPPC